MPIHSSPRGGQGQPRPGNEASTMSDHAQPTTPDPVAVTVRLARQLHAGSGVARADDMDIVEVWGRDSFPASDPPANW
jgi:hypothetical protein